MKNDLFNALNNLPIGKILEPNGILSEFLKELWDNIIEDLIIYTNAILAQGPLGNWLL